MQSSSFFANKTRARTRQKSSEYGRKNRNMISNFGGELRLDRVEMSCSVSSLRIFILLKPKGWKCRTDSHRTWAVSTPGETAIRGREGGAIGVGSVSPRLI